MLRLDTVGYPIKELPMIAIQMLSHNPVNRRGIRSSCMLISMGNLFHMAAALWYRGISGNFTKNRAAGSAPCIYYSAKCR